MKNRFPWIIAAVAVFAVAFAQQNLQKVKTLEPGINGQVIVTTGGKTAWSSSVALPGSVSAANLSGTNTGDQDLSGLAVKANNLSDLTSASTARTNLGLGTAATKDVPASGDAALGEVVKGNDTRLTDTRTPTDNTVSTAKIQNNAVTLGKLATQADQTILGNNSGGASVPSALSASTVKTVLSLGNVENTALSTWTGSTNLATLGTVTTGTWNATAIGITKGGTGQTTASAGFNALSPLTTLGDILYASGANTNARLAGNTTTTQKVLAQTGNGTTSAAPTWIDPTGISVGGDVSGTVGSQTVAKINGVSYSADPLSQYALLAGRSGGQTVTGGTASGENLTLTSTSNGTKGKIVLGSASTYDQANDRLGLGTTSPSYKLDVSQTNGTTVDNFRLNNFGVTWNAADAGITKINSLFTTVVSHTSGSIGQARGVHSNMSFTGNGGTTSTDIGFLTTLAVSSGHTASDHKGVYVANATGAGTVSQQIGIYLESMTKGASNYAIYSAGGQSVHAGNLRVGSTAAPNYTVDVAGDINFTGTLYQGGSPVISNAGVTRQTGGYTIPTTEHTTFFTGSGSGTATITTSGLADGDTKRIVNTGSFTLTIAVSSGTTVGTTGSSSFGIFTCIWDATNSKMYIAKGT